MTKIDFLWQEMKVDEYLLGKIEKPRVSSIGDTGHEEEDDGEKEDEKVSSLIME